MYSYHSPYFKWLFFGYNPIDTPKCPALDSPTHVTHVTRLTPAVSELVLPASGHVGSGPSSGGGSPKCTPQFEPRVRSNIQYQISYHIYIYTYHKSKCIIISSHVLSCFVIYCLILSYTISCISSMDWFNIKMIGSHGCLPILGGFPVDFLLQNYGTAFSRLEKRNPWWTIKRLSISVLHQMHLEPSMAMKQTSAKLMELRYLGDS